MFCFSLHGHIKYLQSFVNEAKVLVKDKCMCFSAAGGWELLEDRNYFAHPFPWALEKHPGCSECLVKTY